MSMHGCRELRNVTFLGPLRFDYQSILEELGPCINSYFYDHTAKKTIQAGSEVIGTHPLFKFNNLDHYKPFDMLQVVTRTTNILWCTLPSLDWNMVIILSLL